MKLTPSQQQAIESVERSTAIIAGAGSGKTEVLTGRLQWLLTKKKLNLSQILCVTFTEKAAQEMKQRIAKGLDKKTRQELPWAPIGTFHSFCLNVLKEFGPLAGLTPTISVWEEATAKLAIHLHCRQGLLKALEEKRVEALLLVEELEFRHALALLEELMGFRWHWKKLQKSNTKKQKSKKEQQFLEATEVLYQRVLQSYEEEKRQRQALDFQDLEILTIRLLQEHPEVKRQLQNRFSHILVDEAQDINDLQEELIQRLFAPGKNFLCVVGDPKQSIYRFRGANVSAFKNIVQLILKTGGERIELKENFRSRPEILEFVNQTFAHLFDPQEAIALQATREAASGPCVEVLPISLPAKTAKEEKRKTEADTIAQYIQQTVAQSQARYGDFALLFQSLNEVRHYEAALRRHSIPHRLFGGRGFLSSQEVLDCLFVLKVMANVNDRLSLVGLMRSPLIGFPDTLITELCLQNSTNLGQALLEKNEIRWLKDLYERKENLSAAEILEQAVGKTHFDLLLDKLDPSGAKLANLEQLITLIRELETKEAYGLEDILEYFETLKKRKTPMAQAPAVDTAQPLCQLMTVHQAKGLQFPIVILPDLIRLLPPSADRYLFVRDQGLGFYLKEADNPFDEGTPSETLLRLKELDKREDWQERKRLLYVALTRAREKLVIPLHEEETAGLWQEWLKESLTESSGYILLHPKNHLEKQPAIRMATECSRYFLLCPPTEPKAWIECPYYTVTDLEKSLRPKEITVEPALSSQKVPGVYSWHLLSAADFGNWVHAVLKDMGTHPALSLKERIRLALFNLNLRASKEEREEAAALLQSFLTGPLAPRSWEGFHEWPFRLKMEKVVVTGTIDYCLETDQGWIIYDFKTDAVFDPNRYQLQMDSYVLALAKAQSKPVLETRLLYLKLEKVHAQPVTPERLQAAEKNLIDILAGIR